MAQTLKFGKGTWATKTGSSMAYNDQNGNYKPLPFNVERDSIATRVNKEGLIEVVGKDKLRIDYTDSAKGVALLENSSTNLITYSEDFSRWLLDGNQSSPTIISDLNPDGSSQVYQINLNSGGNIYRTISISSSIDYTFSVYIKGTGVGRLILSNPQPTPENYVDFTATSEWQRIELTGSSSSTSVRIAIGSWSNSTANGTIQIYGAQLEQESYPTSYIPTSGSTYQRQADVVNGSGNSEVFNDSEGVLFADISALADDLTFRLITLKGSSDDVRFGFRSNSNMIYVQIGSAAFLTHTVSDIKLFNKVAIKYGTSGTKFIINGFEVGTDLDDSSFLGINSFNFDLNGGSNFYGKAKEVGYYDATLTDSELEYLTSYRSLNELVTELNLNTL